MILLFMPNYEKMQSTLECFENSVRLPHFLIQFPRKLLFFKFGNPKDTVYIRLKVTVHKCAETIQGRKLYEEIQYLKIFSSDFNFSD